MYPHSKFFKPFWVIMREHIHHFDVTHMMLLAGINGFKIARTEHGHMPIMSESMRMPVLTILFEAYGKDDIANFLSVSFSELKDSIGKYVDSGVAAVERIAALLPKNKQICFWGIGREFMFINKFFSEYKNKVLVDNNSYKQTMTVEGLKVHDESVLGSLDKDAYVIITAMAHKDVLHKKLIEEYKFGGYSVDL